MHKPFISKALKYGPFETEDHTVLPVTHTQTIPAFTPQLQSTPPFVWHSLRLPKDGQAELTWVVG